MARHFSLEDILAFGKLIDLFENPERYGLRIEKDPPDAMNLEPGLIVAECQSRLKSLQERGLYD